MAVAESIAAISAVLQAADMYAKYGEFATSGFTSLNLGTPSGPIQRAAQQIAANVPPGYDEMFQAILDSTQRCVDRFRRAIQSDDLLPEQRMRLGTQLRLCVCAEIRNLRDAMSADFPDELNHRWEIHRCASA